MPRRGGSPPRKQAGGGEHGPLTDLSDGTAASPVSRSWRRAIRRAAGNQPEQQGRKAVQAPNAPTRGSRRISSARSRVYPPKRPSQVFIRPSRCNPPVMTRLATTATNPQQRVSPRMGRSGGGNGDAHQEPYRGNKYAARFPDSLNSAHEPITGHRVRKCVSTKRRTIATGRFAARILAQSTAARKQKPAAKHARKEAINPRNHLRRGGYSNTGPMPIRFRRLAASGGADRGRKARR
jgi:hypothetical protein